MAAKVVFVNVFNKCTDDFSAHRYEDCSGVDITDQTFTWSIPELLRLFDGDMVKLRQKFNNHLLFESALGGVFIDELNEKEVDEYKKREAEYQAKLKAAEEEKALFEAYKADVRAKADAAKVDAAKADAAPPAPPAE